MKIITSEQYDEEDPPACRSCRATKLSECECDPTPWCTWCGAKTKKQCDCGPIADNN